MIFEAKAVILAAFLSAGDLQPINMNPAWMGFKSLQEKRQSIPTFQAEPVSQLSDFSKEVNLWFKAQRQIHISA